MARPILKTFCVLLIIKMLSTCGHDSLKNIDFENLTRYVGFAYAAKLIEKNWSYVNKLNGGNLIDEVCNEYFKNDLQQKNINPTTKAISLPKPSNINGKLPPITECLSISSQEKDKYKKLAFERPQMVNYLFFCRDKFPDGNFSVNEKIDKTQDNPLKIKYRQVTYQIRHLLCFLQIHEFKINSISIINHKFIYDINVKGQPDPIIVSYEVEQNRQDIMTLIKENADAETKKGIFKSIQESLISVAYSTLNFIGLIENSEESIENKKIPHLPNIFNAECMNTFVNKKKHYIVIKSKNTLADVINKNIEDIVDPSNKDKKSTYFIDILIRNNIYLAIAKINFKWYKFKHYCDIKPENISVTIKESAPKKVENVLFFVTNSITNSRCSSVTPFFAAPELDFKNHLRYYAQESSFYLDPPNKDDSFVNSGEQDPLTSSGNAKKIIYDRLDKLKEDFEKKQITFLINKIDQVNDKIVDYTGLNENYITINRISVDQNTCKFNLSSYYEKKKRDLEAAVFYILGIGQKPDAYALGMTILYTELYIFQTYYNFQIKDKKDKNPIDLIEILANLKTMHSKYAFINDKNAYIDEEPLISINDDEFMIGMTTLVNSVKAYYKGIYPDDNSNDVIEFNKLLSESLKLVHPNPKNRSTIEKFGKDMYGAKYLRMRNKVKRNFKNRKLSPNKGLKRTRKSKHLDKKRFKKLIRL